MKIRNKTLLLLPLVIGLVGQINGMKREFGHWAPEVKREEATDITNYNDKKRNFDYSYAWKRSWIYRLWGFNMGECSLYYQQHMGHGNEHPYKPEIKRPGLSLYTPGKVFLGGTTLLTLGGFWYWWKSRK